MTDTIAVVKPFYVKQKAYRMGYEEFSDLDGEETEDFDLAPFKGSARWSNTIAPRLRAMAGYSDTGPGTYTEDREVAAIERGAEEDTPAEAEITEARHIYQKVVQSFDVGALDAAEGRNPDHGRVPG